MADGDNELENDGLDDLDLDFELGDPDTSVSPESGREAVTQVSSSFARGVKDDMLNPGDAQRKLKKVLPDEYGQALDVANEATGTAKDLYNTAVKESRQGVNEFKKASKRILDQKGDKLPPKVREKLGKLLEPDRNRRQSIEAAREEELSNNLASIFETQMEANQQIENQRSSEAELKEQVEQKRHEGNMAVTSDVRDGIMRMVSYQDTVNARYQRKSLELQYRQFYVASDTFRLAETTAKDTKEALQGILKNTGLPEYRKIQISEAGMQNLRERILGDAQNRISEYTTNFRSKFGQNLVDKVREKSRDFGDNLSMVAMGMDQVADNAEAGIASNPWQDGAGMAGGMAANKAFDKLSPRMRKLIEKNPEIMKRAAQLGIKIDNIPRIMNRWAESDSGDGMLGGFVQSIKDLVPRYRQDDKVGEADVLTADKAVGFDSLTRKSITEIIPGYLSRIHQEIYSLRTGDTDDGSRLRFDSIEGKFSTENEIRKTVDRTVFKSDDVQSGKDQVYELVDLIDSDKRMSKKAREALAKRLLSESFDNEEFDPAAFTDESRYEEGLDDRTLEELSDVFNRRFGIDEEGKVQNDEATAKFSQEANRQFNQLANRVNDPYAQIQAMIDLGYRDKLEELDLVRREGYDERINYDNVWDRYAKGGGVESYGETMDGRPGDGGGTGRLPAGGMAHDDAMAGSYRHARGDASDLARPLNGREVVWREGEETLQRLIEENQTNTTSITDLLRQIRDCVCPDNNQRAEMEGDPRSSKEDMDPVIQAIRENSTRDISEHHSQLLTDILDTLRTGIAVNGEGSPAAMGALERLVDRSLTGVGHVGRGLGAGLSKFYGGLGGGIKGAGGLVSDGLRGTGRTIGNMFGMNRNDMSSMVRNVYAKGGNGKAILEARLMRRGEYFDSETNEPILNLEDLKNLQGNVVDRYGQIVATGEDFKDGIMDRWGNEIKLPSGFMSAIGGALGSLTSGLGRFYGGLTKPLTWASSLARKGMDFVNRVKDVYVPGEERPRLLATIIKNGGYVNASTGRPIRSLKDIDGDVADLQGNVVLPLDDMRDGLVDINGNPISGMERLVQRAKDILMMPVKGIKWGYNRAKDVLRAGRDMVKGGFDSLTSKFGGQADADLVSVNGDQLSVLENIYGLLKERLPSNDPNLWDRDGDGDRDGGWRDQFASRKAANDDQIDDGRDNSRDRGDEEKGGGLLATIMERLMGGGDGIDIDIGGGADIDMGGRDRNGQRGGKPRGRIGRAWQGLKNLARRGGGRLMASRAGQAAAMGATALAGSSAVTAATTAVGTAAAAAGTFLAGITAPVWGGIALGAAAAVGGWMLYRKLSARNQGELTKLRLLQYGVRPDDEEKTSKIFYLEDYLSDKVEESGGQLVIKEDNIDRKELLEGFGVDLEDRGQIESFYLWMTQRFAPVYLAHLKALKELAPSTELEDVDDDLEGIVKKRYVEMVRRPGGEESPYRAYASPFSTYGSLVVREREIEAAIQEILAKLETDEESEEETDTSTRSGGVLGVDVTASVESARRAREERRNNEEMGEEAQDTRDRGAPQRSSRSGPTSGSTATTPENRNVRHLDALDAVRMKAYGLKELKRSKVELLMEMEEATWPYIRFNNEGKARFSGESEEFFETYATRFGIPRGTSARTVEERDMAVNWIKWFKTRFIHTYTAYLNGLSHSEETTSGSVSTVTQHRPSPELALAVAETLTALIVPVGNENMLVWSIPFKPFPDEELNTDPNSVTGNLQALRRKITDRALSEETRTEARRQSTDVPSASQQEDNSRRPRQPSAESGTTGGSNAQSSSSSQGSGAASDYAQDQMNSQMAGDFHRGTVIRHPGNGTGGDINDLPMSQGDGSWDAHKDLIVQAALMAGVDPALMAQKAAIESSFNATVSADSSSATGLFQFIDSTWTDMLKRYGHKYGISPNASRGDPRANALMAAEYLKENKPRLEEVVDRPLTDTDYYAAHFLGAGGARTLLRNLQQNPNEIAANIFPDQAASNPSVFKNKDRSYRTIAEVYQDLSWRIGRTRDTFGAEARAMAASMQPAANDSGDEGPMLSEAALNGAKTIGGMASASTEETPESSGTPAAPSIGSAYASSSDDGETQIAEAEAGSGTQGASKVSVPAPDISNSNAIREVTSTDENAVNERRRRRQREAEMSDQIAQRDVEQETRAMGEVASVLRESLNTQRNISSSLNEVLSIMKTRQEAEGVEGEQSTQASTNPNRGSTARQSGEIPRGAVNVSRRRSL